MGKPIGYHPARLQRAFRTSIYFPQEVGLRSNKNNVKKQRKKLLFFSAMSCFTLKKIRNGAAHTLFDSFATAPVSRTLFPKIFEAKYSPFRLHFAIFLSGKRQKNGIANAETAEQSLQMFLGKGGRGKANPYFTSFRRCRMWLIISRRTVFRSAFLPSMSARYWSAILPA